jgi:hypothetical protein
MGRGGSLSQFPSVTVGRENSSKITGGEKLLLGIVKEKEYGAARFLQA